MKIQPFLFVFLPSHMVTSHKTFMQPAEITKGSEISRDSIKIKVNAVARLRLKSITVIPRVLEKSQRVRTKIRVLKP